MSQIVGFDARSYPSPKGAEIGNMILLTILTERADGSVKAYSGIVPDTSRQDPQYREPAKWVQRHGSPLRLMEARRIWPGLRDMEYAA